jgi:PIN domain nuclease of toxin-antitoxin system
LNLLIDTHLAIWYAHGDAKMPTKARHLIEDVANTSFVSVASIWEIAIKFALRRGRAQDVPFSGSAAITYFERVGFELLPIMPDQAAHVEFLPTLHGDPFDRMMLAQARIESMRFVTHDAILADYGDFVELV